MSEDLPMQTSMNTYLLHPTAPLVFGTGKPLDFGLGGDSLTFPFPSTVAGAVRAAAAVKANRPADPYDGRDRIVLGPTLLARLDAAGQFDTALLPRPADAVYIGGHVVPLCPVKVPADQFSDLPEGLQPLALKAGGVDVNAKPDAMPPWWTIAAMEAWLRCAAVSRADGAFVGDKGAREAARTHVVIKPLGKGAKEQGLFRSTGNDFGHPIGAGGYALATSTNAGPLDGEARRVGGEGRFARFSAADGKTLWPAMPKEAANTARIRVVLITPAVFESGGWRPDWIGKSQQDGGASVLKGTWPETHFEVTLVAAAISRAQSYSPWQKYGNATGPGRAWRVVPAGSVYWFDIPARQAAALHGRSLCTGQWQRDGWGYGLVGVG
jgi:CRISPR-associated protein Cmr3